MRTGHLTQSLSSLVRLLAVLAVLLVQTTGLSAQAVRQYSASISPISDTSGHALSSYTVTITNDAASTDVLGSVNVTVPSGYSDVVLGTVTAPTGKTWTASLVSGVIQLRASANGSRLSNGQSMSVAFTATVPCPASPPTSYTWLTAAKKNIDFAPGGATFTRVGSDPAVEVTGTCATPTVSVADVTVCEGEGTTLTASATGCESYTYQWYAGSSVGGGALISGAASSTYAPTTSGDYTCLVSCVGGGSDEDYGTLTINPLPTVSVADVTVCDGGNTTLAASVGGCGTYSYQWYAGSSSGAGTLIPDATGSTYAPATSGDYTCVVTCVETGCSNEDYGTLTINPLPTVSVADVTVCDGGDTTLTASARGCQTYSHQWYAGGSSATGTLIPEATGSTYAPNTSGDYTCVVTCVETGCSKEDYGTLTINPLPTVSVADKTVSEGGDTTLTASAGGCQNYSHQWYAGGSSATGTLIPDATGSTYAPATSGDYTCVVTCVETGCSNEDYGTLTINPHCAYTVRGEELGRSEPYWNDQLGQLCQTVTYAVVDAYDASHRCGTTEEEQCQDYQPCTETDRGQELGRGDPYWNDQLQQVCQQVTYECSDTYTGEPCPDETVEECQQYQPCSLTTDVEEESRGRFYWNEARQLLCQQVAYVRRDVYTGEVCQRETGEECEGYELCTHTTAWVYTYSAWAWDTSRWDMCRDVTMTKYDRYDRSHVCDQLRERECRGQQLPRPNPGSCPTCLEGLPFQSYRTGNWEIYRADGCEATRLTYNQAEDTAPQWDPTRRHIVFQSMRDGNWEIYTMAADGENQVNVSKHPAADTAPNWSCSHIYFQSDRDGNAEIYRMNPDGSGQTRLTNNLVPDAQPAASCTRGKVAFQSQRNGSWELCVMNLDGTNVQCLTNTPWDEVSPTWSSGGDRIAFQTNQGGFWRIAVMDLASGTVQYLTRVNGGAAQSPVWYSAPCDWIYFQALNYGDWDVYRVKPDGTVSERAVSHPTARDMLDDQVAYP